MSSWYVYLVRCADDKLYCGVTTDTVRRVREHNGELSGGARFTRSRRPVSMVWCEAHESRTSATQREAAVKRLTRSEKLVLVASFKS